MERGRVLVVAYDRPISELICHWLEDADYETLAVSNSRLAEQLWRGTRSDVAILDYNLADVTALELIPRLRALDSSTPLILLTGYGSVENATHGIELGADQVLAKPVKWSTLEAALQHCLANHRSRRWEAAEKIRRLQETVDPFAGISDTIRELAERAQKIAEGDSAVLIQGETGTGKGVLARWIHEHGARASDPFVRCRFGGSSVEAQGVELFGDDATGSAPNLQPGAALVLIARKGSVLLQDIGDLDPQLQCRLVRILDEKPFRGAAEITETRMGVRWMAATRHIVPRLVRERRVRGDLFFRLSGSAINVPPLRERIGDVPALSTCILADLARDLSMSSFGLSNGAVRALQNYSWPGNIRELKNLLEHAVLMTGSAELTEDDLQIGARVTEDLTVNGRLLTLEEVEREYIERILCAEKGRVESAAKKLGVPRSSLYHKIKQYGLGRKALRAVQGRSA